MAMLQFDEAGAQDVDRMYATKDIVAQRQLVLNLLALQPDERVLDVGSGPGYLVAEMGQKVGPDGAVYGVDASAAMNKIAATRVAGKSWLHIDQADALNLPFPDRMFDVAVATQVYEYVEDIPRALRELRRVIRPGGRVLILDTDWDSLVWHTNDRDLHQRVIAAWEEHLVHPRLPRVLARLLRDAGFSVTGQRVHVMLNTELDSGSFSASAMRSIADFVVGRHGLTEADTATWLEDLQDRSRAGEYFYSINRYIAMATT